MIEPDWSFLNDVKFAKQSKLSKEKLIAGLMQDEIPLWQFLKYNHINACNTALQKKFNKSNNLHWNIHLRILARFKICTQCHKLLSLNSFYSTIHFGNGLQSECINCNKKQCKKYKQTEAGKAINRFYRAQYRAAKLNQTPKDADLELIKQIYLECPEGYEVDHIKPLSKGGLHHHDNLQYLTMHNNRKKSDKYPYDIKGLVPSCIAAQKRKNIVAIEK